MSEFFSGIWKTIKTQDKKTIIIILLVFLLIFALYTIGLEEPKLYFGLEFGPSNFVTTLKQENSKLEQERDNYKAKLDTSNSSLETCNKELKRYTDNING